MIVINSSDTQLAEKLKLRSERKAILLKEAENLLKANKIKDAIRSLKEARTLADYIARGPKVTVLVKQKDSEEYKAINKQIIELENQLKELSK